MIERDEDGDAIPAPDPSDLEPDLKTMPYVPGAGAKLPSTIPPASSDAGSRASSASNGAIRRARSGFQRAYRIGSGFVESSRAKLPGSIRKTCERIPTSALLGVALAVPCFALGAFVVALSTSPASSEKRPASATKALKLDVNAAARPAERHAPAPRTARPAPAREPSQALPAQVMISATAPFDAADEASVLLNLADTLASQHRDEEAVAVLDRLLARRPDLRSDARVASVLMQTVYSDERSVVNASFALLEGPMAEDGATLMYQLSRSRDVRDGPRRRAETWLKSKAFDRVSPLPLYTLVKLELAKSCEEKRALLGLASAGGQETLDYLRQLEARTTCAPDDLANCYPCLRADSRLGETIARLEKRLGT